MGNSSVKKNFVWQTLAQILKIILPIITSPYLSRILGGKGTGIYSYTSSIVAYYTMFMMLGIENYGSRRIARVRDDHDKMNKVFSELIVLHICICIVVAMIYLIYIFNFAKYKLLISIQGMVVLSMFFSIGWFYNGLEEIRITAIRFLIIKIVSFILLFVFVKGEKALVNYTMLMSISSLISELVLWIKIKDYARFVVPTWKGMKEHIPHMFILFIPMALESIYNIMDKIMLGRLTDISEVGYYEYASKALIIRTIISSLGVVLLPRISNLYENKNYKKMWQYIDESLKVSIVFAIAVSFGIASIATDFAPLFWGKEFAKSGNIMIVLSFTTIFWGIAQVIRTQYLIPTDKDKEYISSIFVGAIVNIALNFIFIPILSGIGAAIATLVTEIIVCIFQCYVVRREFIYITPLYSYLIYVLFGFIMMVCVEGIKYVMPTTWIIILIEVLCGGLVYLVLCLLYWRVKNDNFYLGLLLNRTKKLSKK